MMLNMLSRKWTVLHSVDKNLVSKNHVRFKNLTII